MQQQRAHRNKTALRRNARYLAQAATVRCNFVRCDAPEPMRPWNHAQGPICFSAVVEMNPNRNQLSQKIHGWLAEPSTLLFRPSRAGSIGGFLRDRNT